MTPFRGITIALLASLLAIVSIERPRSEHLAGIIPAPAATAPVPTVDNSIGEVGNFTASFLFYRVNAFEALPGAIPASVSPAPPPGFVAGTPSAAGDVDYVASFSNLTAISANISFPPQPQVSAFVELRNGNYGLVQDLVIQWNGGSPQDFADVVFAGDMFAVTGGSARFRPQLVPSSDAEDDFEEIRIVNGNPGPYSGLRLPLGYLTNVPPFGFADSPVRAWRLTPAGTLNTGGQATIKIAFDMGVPVENTAVASPSTAQPLDLTTLTSPVTVTYSEVTVQGQTSLTTSTQGPPLPSGFQLGSPATYYQISTTASSNGSILVCIDYSDVQYPDENSLQLLHTSDGVNWTDITSSLDTVNDIICGITTSFSIFAVVEPKPDADADGLPDEDEPIYGTNPLDPDTDDDGLLDGTEVEMAQGGPCPNPLVSDSDGDGLSDGYEVNVLGTSPCLADTDGDAIPDFWDPYPLTPGATNDVLEQIARALAAQVDALDLDLLTGPNANANSGRRNSLANRLRNAANALASGHVSSAHALLTSVLQQIDGLGPAPDWIEESPERVTLATGVSLLLSLLAP